MAITSTRAAYMGKGRKGRRRQSRMFGGRKQRP